MNDRTNDKSKEPMNDYLWDASGTPDPEVQQIESLLSEFRYQERPLILPAELPAKAKVGWPTLSAAFAERVGTFLRPLQKGWIPRVAGAALILLTISAGAFFLLRPSVSNSAPGWTVSNLQGAPRIEAQTLSASSANAKLRVGQTLSTDSSSRASLYETDLGQIQVDPDSRLRLLQSAPNHKRIQLDLGTIHAYIWARPTQFVVDTPSAVAVDLGCAYTLHVDPDGSGTIRTRLGWVGFHLNGRDSFIPAGAMCSTRPSLGPGTPYFEDASAGFRKALDAFDHAPQSANAGSPQFAIILHEARAKDALTLWHLLARTSGSERAQVYDRLSALVRPPQGVTRDGILQLDPHMLDLYWNALDLGDISIWHFWEQSSSPSR